MNVYNDPSSDLQPAIAQQETCFKIKKSLQNIAQLEEGDLIQTCKEFRGPVIIKP